MSDGPLTPEERDRRRRRLAEIFGDVLPEQTSDDKAEAEPQPDDDERFRREVPPHHGSG